MDASFHVLLLLGLSLKNLAQEFCTPIEVFET